MSARNGDPDLFQEDGGQPVLHQETEDPWLHPSSSLWAGLQQGSVRVTESNRGGVPTLKSINSISACSLLADTHTVFLIILSLTTSHARVEIMSCGLLPLVSDPKGTHPQGQVGLGQWTGRYKGEVM